MKLTSSLALLFLCIVGSHTLPHGQYLYQFPSSSGVYQQTHQGQPLDGRVLLLNNNVIPQGPTYLGHDGLVYLKDIPAEAGYVESVYPSYDGNTPAQEMQPPVQAEISPVDSKPVPEERQPAPAEPEEVPKTNAKEGRSEKPAKLEEFEPDAELIPDDLKNTSSPPASSAPVPPPQPQIPLIPYPASPGLSPGQKVYFINGIPHVLTGYPQFNTIQPQTTFRYPSVFNNYPQQFLIYEQPGAVQTVQHQPGTIFLDYSNNLLRSNQVQNLQVPPFPFFKRQLALASPQNQQPQINNPASIESRFLPSAPEKVDEASEMVADEESTMEDKHEDMPQNPQAGLAAMAFSRYLQRSNNEESLTNEESDSVVIEAEKGDKKEKVEIVHADLKSSPSLAQAAPHGVAVAGEGGSAQSSPSGSAVAGPAGLAVSDPVATALAGPYLTKSSVKDEKKEK
ncbi:uncharacterized protein LOC143912153 [Arctopsyche grandis]|uniref:uncharacterized protein LOC143912153 n=1 Tax=Arctopsyche grandis TaxID=121162 RepID=UPI00406D7FB4